MTGTESFNGLKSIRSRVLVVDDEEDIRNLVSFNLRAAGLEVLTAEDGAAAVESIRADHPDLVILDLMLPELDGVSVYEWIRRLPETATTPVIMLTAWATERARLVGLEAGATDYITKPFSPRELVKRVRSLLAVDALRRRGGPACPFKRLTIDLEAGRVFADGREIELRPGEFHKLTELFEALVKRLGPLTRSLPND